MRGSYCKLRTEEEGGRGREGDCKGLSVGMYEMRKKERKKELLRGGEGGRGKKG